MKNCILNSLYFVLAVTLFISIDRQARADATDADIQTAASLLARDFKPFVITLDRDIRVYHYFYWNPKGGKDASLDHPIFNYYFVSKINKFWHENGIVSADPIYAAADPQISRSYGTDLLEITIHKGSHILIGHHDLGFTLSQDTIPALAKVGDSATNKLFRMDGLLTFIPRKVLALALKSLDVEVVTYQWGADDSDNLCHTLPATFLILGTPIDLDKTAQGKGAIGKKMTVVGYSSGSTTFTDDRKRQAYAKIERFLKTNHSKFITAQPPDEANAEMSDAEKQDWREHIFACDGRHPTDEPAQKSN